MAGNQNSGNRNAAQNLSDDDRARGGSMSSGNFKYDRDRARREGAKGGRASHGGRQGKND